MSSGSDPFPSLFQKFCLLMKQSSEISSTKSSDAVKLISYFENDSNKTLSDLERLSSYYVLRVK